MGRQPRTVWQIHLPLPNNRAILDNVSGESLSIPSKITMVPFSTARVSGVFRHMVVLHLLIVPRVSNKSRRVWSLNREKYMFGCWLRASSAVMADFPQPLTDTANGATSQFNPVVTRSMTTWRRCRYKGRRRRQCFTAFATAPNNESFLDVGHAHKSHTVPACGIDGVLK
jgi:hypothetical protein